MRLFHRESLEIINKIRGFSIIKQDILVHSSTKPLLLLVTIITIVIIIVIIIFIAVVITAIIKEFPNELHRARPLIKPKGIHQESTHGLKLASKDMAIIAN